MIKFVLQVNFNFVIPLNLKPLSYFENSTCWYIPQYIFYTIPLFRKYFQNWAISLPQTIERIHPTGIVQKKFKKILVTKPTYRHTIVNKSKNIHRRLAYSKVMPIAND